MTETLTHPFTMATAAISAVGGMWWAAINPDPASVGICVGIGLVSFASWVVNYLVRGEKLANRHVAKLRKLREQAKHTEARSLVGEFRSRGFDECASSALELEEAYRKLEDYLRQRADTEGNLSAERFLVLAEETYEQGLLILQKILHL